jgi:hypothetical protein
MTMISEPRVFDAMAAYRAIRDDGELKPLEKLVAFVLVTRAAAKDDDTKGHKAGAWTWGQRRIAKDAGVSRGALKRALDGLESKRGGPGGPWRLTITKRTVADSKERDVSEYTIEVGPEKSHVAPQKVHRGSGGDPPVGPEKSHGGSGGDPTLLSLLPDPLPASGESAPSALALRVDEPRQKKTGAKHTPEEIAEKDKVVNAFVAGVKRKKNVAPKLTHPGDHRAAFEIAKVYGVEEGREIVRRALEDDFVVSKNCTLRYIASKADTWRGTAPKPSGKHAVQQAPAAGSCWDT